MKLSKVKEKIRVSKKSKKSDTTKAKSRRIHKALI